MKKNNNNNLIQYNSKYDEYLIVLKTKKKALNINAFESLKSFSRNFACNG